MTPLNSTKTRDEMIREHYLDVDRMCNSIPQGREPFHPRKLTGPHASFLGTVAHTVANSSKELISDCNDSINNKPKNDPNDPS